MNGWREDDEKGAEKIALCNGLFCEIWDSLNALGDKDGDGRVSVEEWVRREFVISLILEPKVSFLQLRMWESMYKKVYENMEDKTKLPTVDHHLPLWCYRYLKYRFHLFDRTGCKE